MKMQVIEGKHLQSGDRSKRGCICAAESISKVATEAKEDASVQPKVSPKWRQKQKRMHLRSPKASPKWRQKQKKMHLRSRRHLHLPDRSKRRCICAAESIFKAPKEEKEDASAQPKVSSPPRQKQKKMHLRSPKASSPHRKGKLRHKMRKSSLTNILTMI